MLYWLCYTLRYNLLFQDNKIRSLSVQPRAALLVNIKCLRKVAACVYCLFCCLSLFIFTQIRHEENATIQKCRKYPVPPFPHNMSQVSVCVHKWAGTAAHLWALHLICISCFHSNFGWLYYGILKHDQTIVLVNFIGALLQMVYIVMYFRYTKEKVSMFAFG